MIKPRQKILEMPRWLFNMLVFITAVMLIFIAIKKGIINPSKLNRRGKILWFIFNWGPVFLMIWLMYLLFANFPAQPHP